MSMPESVNCGLLEEEQRNIPTLEKETPFVIEATARCNESINRFFAIYSSQVMEGITNNGAVLLRNFGIRSEKDFEQAILSIEGMRGIDCYFMSEQGRTLVEGTKFIFYTNKLYKTGGSWRLGDFTRKTTIARMYPGSFLFVV